MKAGRKFKELVILKFEADFKGNNGKVRYEKDKEYAMHKDVADVLLKKKGAKAKLSTITKEQANEKYSKKEEAK